MKQSKRTDDNGSRTVLVESDGQEAMPKQADRLVRKDSAGINRGLKSESKKKASVRELLEE